MLLSYNAHYHQAVHCTRWILPVFPIVPNNPSIQPPPQHHTSEPIQVHVTYLELYNEVGYDLLDASRGQASPQGASLARVTILEDEQGALHLRNVAMHRVAGEEDALQLVCCL